MQCDDEEDSRAFVSLYSEDSTPESFFFPARKLPSVGGGRDLVACYLSLHVSIEVSISTYQSRWVCQLRGEWAY